MMTIVNEEIGRRGKVDSGGDCWVMVGRMVVV